MPPWKTFNLSQQQTDTLSLVQLTDTHILGKPGTDFDGVDTSESLARVITAVKEDENWPPDAVLVTGDLVHEPVRKAYQRLRDQLESLAVPVFCLAGNHDAPELMQTVLPSNNIHLPKIINTEHWQIILLNSYVPGTHSGHIDEQELKQLDQTLAQTDKPVLICLHHPPVSVHSSWMDTMPLDNPDALFSVLDRYKNIKAVLWGHIHQEFHEERNGVSLLASPSTCVQFTPKSDRYIKDTRTPGCRWLQLKASGELETTVQRVE